MAWFNKVDYTHYINSLQVGIAQLHMTRSSVRYHDHLGTYHRIKVGETLIMERIYLFLPHLW